MTKTTIPNKISKITINYYKEYNEYISNIIGNNPLILNIRVVKEKDKDYSTVTYRHYNAEFVDICKFKICIDPMDFFDKVSVATNETSTVICFNKNMTGISIFTNGKLLILHHMSNLKPYILETDQKYCRLVVDNLIKKQTEENIQYKPGYSCKCGAKKGKLFYDYGRATGYICPICMTPVDVTESKALKELIKNQRISLNELKEAIFDIGTKSE